MEMDKEEATGRSKIMKKKIISITLSLALTTCLLYGCGSAEATSSAETVASQASSVASSAAVSSTTASASTSETGTTSAGTPGEMSNEEIVKKAAEDGMVGNWGLGNEYEIKALLAKYGEPTDYLSQAFDMDGFDDGSIELASAMTYNELGLVKNSYEGGYSYGDTVGTIDMNEEGVAMLEDNIFCTKTFAKENPITVKAFLYASLKGWADACADPDAAADIVYKYGSSVSPDHQKYMATEVKKLMETDTNGNTVTDYGHMDEDAMQQTLDLAKKYISLDDATAASKLQALSLDDIRDTSFWEEVNASSDGNFGTPEKTDISIQLKWLPQAQFMGYYVALDKGYYKDAGLNVTITPGGGDISETTAVNNGTVDFGQTWVSNLIAADAGGMDLVEVSQLFQRSGLDLVYKLDTFKAE